MAEQSAPAPDNRWYNIPLPLIESTSLPPVTPERPIEPESPGEKARNTLARTIGPKAVLNRALLAGLSQWRNQPEEWGQGWDAYGQRLGYRYLRLASRNGIILGFDLAMKTDQRYDRCNCFGFWPRTGHAFKRVFVARTDSGGQTINMGRLAGAYGGLAISYQVLPDRYKTSGRILSHGSQYLAWRVVGNAVREFWPEIHRLIRIGPNPTR